jgi:DNA end-binding protein Ku
MRQAIWTGHISFGLVTIPVKMYPATEPKDVRFHLYDRRSGKRVHYQRVTREWEPPVFEPEDSDPDAPPFEPAAEREMPSGRAVDALRASRADPQVDDDADDASLERDEDPAPQARVDQGDVVRGFQLPTGDLVTVSEAELAELAPVRSRTIDIEEFVDLADIDPVFFEKTYYLAPARVPGADKPYALLHEAMRASRMVAIGRFVLRTRPHLVAVRPLERSLALETLFFGDEVRSPEEVAGAAPTANVSERELRTAQQLIRALATEWVPEKHADAYREELLAMLRRKAPAARVEVDEVAPASPVDDLMAALKKSVEAAKMRRAEAPAKARARDTRARRAR